MCNYLPSFQFDLNARGTVIFFSTRLEFMPPHLGNRRRTNVRVRFDYWIREICEYCLCPRKPSSKDTALRKESESSL